MAQIFGEELRRGAVRLPHERVAADLSIGLT
jgi:hypothetical protein